MDFTPLDRFHRLRGGDSGALVGPSCKSPIKRQGITLMSVTLHDLQTLEGGPRFPAISSCRHEDRTVSSLLFSMFGLQSLRILSSGSVFPADCLHLTHFHSIIILFIFSSSVGFSGVPANGRIFIRRIII